jgi:hypothetical protein
MRYDPQVNFSAGELSPQLRGRVDIDAYQHAAWKMENFQPLQYGGVRRRFGTELIYGIVQSRLVPFVLGVGQSYVISLSNLGIQAWPVGVSIGPSYPVLGSIWTTTTPWTMAQVPEVRYAQSGNFMVFCHPEHPPYALSRRSDTDWWFRPLTFLEPPMADSPIYLRATGDVTVASGVGTGRAATGTAGTFFAADVGRSIIRGSGYGIITAVASDTAATVHSFIDFNGTTGGWFLGGQPRASLAFSAIGEVGQEITITSTPAGWRVGDADGYLFANNGVYRLGTPSPDGITILARVVRKPTASTTTTTYRLMHPTFGWPFGQSAEYRREYPTAVAFHDQRLVFGGLKGLPQTFIGSVAGDVLDFTRTDDPVDAYQWNIEGAGSILHLLVDNDLLALTVDSEHAVSGPDYSTVTNQGVRIRKQSTDGASRVAPVKVGREHIFVQRSGKSVQALGFEIQIQGYDTKELTLLAEHITGPGIVDMAFARRPVPTLYCVRSDGRMACLTLDQKQRVTAWWLWATEGTIESVVSVPLANYDEVWMTVLRGGFGTDRLLERIQQTYQPTVNGVQSSQVLGYLLDAARLYTSTPAGPTGSTLITTSLPEGTLVQVQADGMFGGTYSVNASGQITVPYTFWQAVVGIPYSALLQPMPPELPTAAGSGMGRAAWAADITVKFHQTIGGTVNDQAVTRPDSNGIPQPRRDAMTTPNVRDFSLDLVNSDVKMGAEGWLQAQPLVIVAQQEPLPMHVLAVVQKLQVNP